MPPQTQATPPVMAEDATPPAAAPAPAEGDQAQTVEVPLSAVGQAKEGDTVQFKVVSLDQQGGMANLAPVTPEAPEGSGSDDLAGAFSKENMKKGEM